MVIHLEIACTANHSSFQVSVHLGNREACAGHIWSLIEETAAIVNFDSTCYLKVVLLVEAGGKNCETSRFTVYSLDYALISRCMKVVLYTA